MTVRKIIRIDKEKCNGCGSCVTACNERAIGLVDGKAVLLRDDFCDGLGNCLPACPTGAISFDFREALDYYEIEYKKNTEQKKETLPCSCSGANPLFINREEPQTNVSSQISSQLNQWPVQIKLVPVKAPYFENANLLAAADCAAYAYGNFHSDFMRKKITLIGCPKLDDTDYSEKLTAILKQNNIKSVTIVRMSVPCCSGIELAVKTALNNCGKMIPWQSATISTDGTLAE